MSQALRKLTASINRSNTMVIFINQIRMKIGVMFGKPETTTGGNALKFYASVRLDIRRIGAIKERDEVVGNQTRVKVVKNKLAPPFKQVEFDIMYGEGISKTGELIDLGVKAGVVEKSGAWFSYDSQRIGQGRENAKIFLKANPDIAAKIEAAVRQNAGLIAEQDSRRRGAAGRWRGGAGLSACPEGGSPCLARAVLSVLARRFGTASSSRAFILRGMPARPYLDMHFVGRRCVALTKVLSSWQPLARRRDNAGSAASFAGAITCTPATPACAAAPRSARRRCAALRRRIGRALEPFARERRE